MDFFLGGGLVSIYESFQFILYRVETKPRRMKQASLLFPCCFIVLLVQ